MMSKKKVLTFVDVDMIAKKKDNSARVDNLASQAADKESILHAMDEGGEKKAEIARKNKAQREVDKLHKKSNSKDKSSSLIEHDLSSDSASSEDDGRTHSVHNLGDLAMHVSPAKQPQAIRFLHALFRRPEVRLDVSGKLIVNNRVFAHPIVILQYLFERRLTHAPLYMSKFRKLMKQLDIPIPKHQVKKQTKKQVKKVMKKSDSVSDKAASKKEVSKNNRKSRVSSKRKKEAKEGVQNIRKKGTIGEKKQTNVLRKRTLNFDV